MESSATTGRKLRCRTGCTGFLHKGIGSARDATGGTRNRTEVLRSQPSSSTPPATSRNSASQPLPTAPGSRAPSCGPALDMRIYHLLLAGASWLEEYGDADVPEGWEFIRTFSPYHLLDDAANLPPTLLLTCIRDDRVHPGPARKFLAKRRRGGPGGALPREHPGRSPGSGGQPTARPHGRSVPDVPAGSAVRHEALRQCRARRQGLGSLGWRACHR